MFIKDPLIEVNHVTLRSVSLPEIGLDIALDVNNPNPVGIRLKTIVFDIYYQRADSWVYICNGEGTGLDIRPGTNEITIPVSVNISGLPGVGIGALFHGEITLQIRGTAFPDFILFAPKVPFTHTVTIPLGKAGS